jgi:hypothetical protein
MHNPLTNSWKLGKSGLGLQFVRKSVQKDGKIVGMYEAEFAQLHILTSFWEPECAFGTVQGLAKSAKQSRGISPDSDLK